MKNHHHWWHKLSEKEKKAIHNPEDCPIISVIDGMPFKIRKQLDKELLYIPYSPYYRTEQIQWINDFGYYLWQNKFHSDPKIDVQKTDLFLKELCKNSLPINYRLYFAAKHPDLIDRCNMSEELTDFLSEVYEVTDRKSGLDLTDHSLTKKVL